MIVTGIIVTETIVAGMIVTAEAVAAKVASTKIASAIAAIFANAAAAWQPVKAKPAKVLRELLPPPFVCKYASIG